MTPKFKVGETVYHNDTLLEVIAVYQISYDSKNSIQYLCKTKDGDVANRSTYKEDELRVSENI